MKNVFILFTCDAWHQNSSYFPIGVFSEKQKAVNFAKKHAESSEEGELDNGDLYLINHIKQTQNRSENYIIEEWDVDQTELN